MHILGRRGLDFPERGKARVRMGTTAGGRHLKVVYVPDEGEDSAFVVTAYELRGKALRAFRRAMRKRK